MTQTLACDNNRKATCGANTFPVKVSKIKLPRDPAAPSVGKTLQGFLIYYLFMLYSLLILQIKIINRLELFII